MGFVSWFVCVFLRNISLNVLPVYARKGAVFFVHYATLVTMVAVTWNTCQAQRPLQLLRNHVRSEISSGKAALVNAMPGDQHLNLSIVLPLHNQQELTSLLGRLYDPSSPDYRHFLSVPQFTEQFGPTEQDYEAVVAFAQENGFTVASAPENRLVVSISGTAAQINQAFNLRMNVYQHPTENRTFFSPDREPSVALAVPIAHIIGLNNFSIPRPMLIPAPHEQQIANVTGSGPGGSYLASDMRAAYYGGTTLNGNGQAVGILEFDGYYLSDVNLTFSNAGQSYNVPINNVLLDGATGAPTQYPDDGEQVLDIAQAIGMAPGLSQVRVYIGSNDADILNSMASENIAKQLSCSWSWGPDDPATADVFFQEFAAQGQSFFAASGDNGAFDAAINPFFYPQEDAYVTAVGGTHLETNGAGGAWSSESAWNTYSLGSGGGISPDGIGIPSWQNGLANSSNGGSAILRNVPDVAMEGDFDNYLCDLGTCSWGAAGTSFAAPRWAGFMALVNQQAVEAGTAPSGGLGFINPAIYAIGQGANYSNDLHDITTGNNDTQSQPVWFSAVAGYDLVTGWGSANGPSLIDDLAGPQVPGFWILASSSTVTLNQGGTSTTTINVTDAGGFSGQVSLAVTSPLPTGVTATWGTNPTSGSSVLTLTAASNAPAGTTALTISGTSGSLTATTNINLAVHSPTFALSASPNNLAIRQGNSGTSTITVTPEYGFTGNVNLSVAGLPSGVTASWSTNPTSGTSVLTLMASASAPASTSTLTITGTSGNITATTTLALAVQAPSFTLSGGGGVNIGIGSFGTSYIYVNPLYGFNGSVNLSVTGLPSGVTASFSPNPTTGSSALTLTASSTAAVGTSTLTVTGTSGSLTATTTVTLGVFAPTFTLSGPGSADIGQGSSVTSYIYVNPQYGFTGSVNLSVSGLPSGVTALWNPNPTSGNSTLTLTASGSAPVGQYTVTITGKSGSLSAATTFTLGVHVPTFTLSTGSLNIGQGTTGTTYVYVYPQYGFTGSVNLSVAGLPSGVTASFTPNPTTGYSSLNVTASSTAATGQYTLTITGTSGTQTATTTLTLGIYVPTFTLYGGGSLNMGQGTSGTSYVYISPQYGFTGSVSLSVSGLPSGVTASFSPNPTTSNSTLTLTASSTASLGQYTLTITGTSGTQTATTTLTLGIYVPTFTLSSAGLSVGQGTSGTTYVNVFPQYGFTGNVNLSVTGMPSGVTASFSPNPTTGSSTLTVTASGTAATGQYTLAVTGTSGTQTASTTLTLGIYVPTFTLYGGGSLNMGQGTSGTSYIYLNPQYGFSGNVALSVSGLPSGVTASFSPNPATSNSILTLSASSSATIGQYSLTITGTSGSQTASTTLALGIYAQAFTIAVNPASLSMNEGASSASAVFVNPQYGFSGNVTLSATNLPSGVTALFSPNPATGSSTLTLTASNAATPGTTIVNITGTSGSLTASTTISLTINTPGFTLFDAPSEIDLAPGDAEHSTIVLVPQNGFAGSVNLVASGLPSGVTASFSPNPATANSTLTLTASNTASVGAANVTITGSSGSLVATATLALTVGTQPATTATTLTVTSGSTPVTSVAAGSAVTLAATVSAGATALTTGQVNFCDATATYCDETHRLGSAQLTNAATAIFKFIPGMGSHTYKAVFVGTNGDAASSSASSSLTVTDALATTTTISQSGNPGNYTLTATTTGQGLLAPAGNVSFLDTSNGNLVVGDASLEPTGTTLSSVNSQTPPTGMYPYSLAVADFNGDGIPDVAVANSNSNNLTILLGNGDGTFTATASSPQTGGSPFFVTVGDFNRDGKVDLAVANVNTNSVTILLGNGDGTFTATASSPQTGNGPESIAVGDFNGDGIQDLAVSNASSNTVTILLGNGDGSFTPTALTPQTGNDPKTIVTGDFNGDGIADLAVTNYWGNTVTILLGNGDGTFAQTSSPSTGSYPSSLAIGDFNGDGIRDLAVTNGASDTVTVLLGNGDGTFTASASQPQTGTEPLSITVGDFNGDGKQDLAIANEYSSSVTILLGNGDGTFTAGGNPSTGIDPASIAAGDFNGDGIPDLVAANYWSNTLTVLTSKLTQTAVATASGISPVGSGSHNVDASYAGDSNYKSSVSAPTTLTGQSVTPTVTATPSSTTISTTQALSVTVSVNGANGYATPTGSVTLTSGSYASPATALSGGSATISVPAGALAIGSDTLTASFTPDTASASLYNGSSGTAPVTVVNATYALTATAVTVAPGASGTSTITVGSTTAYDGTVSLTCAVTSQPAGASDLPTCTSAQTVTLSANTTSGMATVTVNTTAASTAAMIWPKPINRRGWGRAGVGSILALLVFFGIPARRRKWQSMLGIFVVMMALGDLVGCGGGGGGSGSGSQKSTNPGTTAGAYTITVTGTGSDSAKTTSTTTFTLTVN